MKAMTGRLPAATPDRATRQFQVRLADAVRMRREELDVSQDYLEREAGVNQTTLSNIECRKGNPMLATLVTVLDTLGLELVIREKSVT